MPQNIDRVIPSLFIGDIRGAQDLQGLNSQGITHIVQAVEGVEPIYKNSFVYKQLNISDSPSQNLIPILQQVIPWIAQAIRTGGSVFIHCWAGVSTSAAIAIGYLIKELQMPYESAHLLCRKARSVVYPNPGFVKQLSGFAKYLKREVFKKNQRQRYPTTDYALVSTKMDHMAERFKPPRPAGMRQDYLQMNQTTSQDRLGANGLVNKGMPLFQGHRYSQPSFEESFKNRIKLPDVAFVSSWVHNDNEKPRPLLGSTFYSRGGHQATKSQRIRGDYTAPSQVSLNSLHSRRLSTFESSQEMKTTPREPFDFKKTMTSTFDFRNSRQSIDLRNPILALSVNIKNDENTQTFQTILDKQRQLQERQKMLLTQQWDQCLKTPIITPRNRQNILKAQMNKRKLVAAN